MTSYFDRVKPTYIEAWPQALCSLSLAQVDIPLSVEDAIALGTNILELYELFPKPWHRDISGIRDRVADAVHKFSKGAFIRLGSRSPKDAWTSGRRCSTGSRALEILLGGSERIQEDLQLAIENHYEPHIFVREWVDLEPWQEFRCFMKGRQLAGISQYHYLDGPIKEILENKASIDWAIGQFFSSQFKNACHLDDVVFDVIVNMREVGEDRMWTVKLLEINPFFELTDPCLFDWRNGGNFDGSFKICVDSERPKLKYDKYEIGGSSP